MDTKISPGIWRHRDFQQADSEAKLAALYLLTNISVNLLGFGQVNPRYFEFETGLKGRALPKGFGALPKGFVHQDDGYWIRGYIGWQFGRGVSLARSNMRFPLFREMEGLGRAWVVLAVLEEYPELEEQWKIFSAAKPLGIPAQGPEQNRAEQNRAEQNRTEKSREEGIGGVGEKGDSVRRRRSAQKSSSSSAAGAVAPFNPAQEHAHTGGVPVAN